MEFVVHLIIDLSKVLQLVGYLFELVSTLHNAYFD